MSTEKCLKLCQILFLYAHLIYFDEVGLHLSKTAAGQEERRGKFWKEEILK